MVNKYVGVSVCEDSVVTRPTNGTVSGHDKSTIAELAQPTVLG